MLLNHGANARFVTFGLIGDRKKLFPNYCDSITCPSLVLNQFCDEKSFCRLNYKKRIELSLQQKRKQNLLYTNVDPENTANWKFIWEVFHITYTCITTSSSRVSRYLYFWWHIGKLYMLQHTWITHCFITNSDLAGWKKTSMDAIHLVVCLPSKIEHIFDNECIYSGCFL